MAYIFLDESGDLGFKPTSSKWFLFTIVLTNDHKKIEKVIKSIRKGLKKKFKLKELHAYHSDAVTKHRMLRKLSELDDFKVMCIILNKKKVYIDLQNQKNYLYNYTANILLDRLHNKKLIKTEEPISLYIDQKDTSKFIRENFEKYLKDNLVKRGNNGKIEIRIKPSHTEKCLQAVDFVSWAIFRKYEKGDYEYYEDIEDRIVEEKLLFS
ncbi:MAG: DUF3800 domain-containing protein [Candidatus Moraniibacteriota bacterium]